MAFIMARNIKLKLTPFSAFRLSALSSSESKKVSQDIVESLEHLSLVDFPNAEAVKCLEDAVNFADKLLEVNTDSIEPLISTVHLRNEHFRDDKVTEVSRRQELMKLAPVSEEQYYITPPGNISLKQKQR